MKRKHSLYVKDILDAVNKIEEFTKDLNYHEFRKDDKTSSAVIRKLEIIGEASKNTPANIRKKHKNIPWSEMSKTRDKIIHGYFEVDHAIIWKTIKEKLPPLRNPLKQILTELEKKD